MFPGFISGRFPGVASRRPAAARGRAEGALTAVQKMPLTWAELPEPYRAVTV